jgi:small subunit ribosomal protein S7e
MSLLLPHLRKLRKAKHRNPKPLEEEVAKALFDLEQNHRVLKAHLPRFHINTAKEVETPKKNVIVVFYPLRYLMLVRKVQKVLTGELEKRFPGRVVAFVAQRKIQKRPSNLYEVEVVQRSKTATAVNDEILNDLIFPCDVVARRWRCRVDGSKQMKIFLDSRDRKKSEARLQPLSVIYRKLTGRQVRFGYMWNPKLQQVAHR